MKNIVQEMLNKNMRLPVICAPMFLVSSPNLVINTCKNGVVGSFPAFNTRTQTALDEWLTTITAALDEEKQANPAAKVAPYAVNLVVHASNKRLHADFEIVKNQSFNYFWQHLFLGRKCYFPLVIGLFAVWILELLLSEKLSVICCASTFHVWSNQQLLGSS